MISLENGNFADASGNTYANGSIVFTLSRECTVTASPFGVVAAQPVGFQLDADGDILPNSGSSAQIFSNAELTPDDSYYLVTIYDQNGARMLSLLTQFTQGAGSTVNLSDLVPYNP